jgi:hypothetical protein
VCDDKSETYLLYFSNLPACCKTKTYDKYLGCDDVYQLTCKIENCFESVETVKIRDKAKDTELEKLDSFVKDEMQKITPNIELLLSGVHYYMQIFREYHDFGKLGILLSSLETLSIIEEFAQTTEFDIANGIKVAMEQKEFLFWLKLNQREPFVNHFLETKLLFLELSNDAKKEMRLDVQIYDGYNDLFLTYLKNSGFDMQEGEEKRFDRFNCSKHYNITKDGETVEFDSIYSYVDDGVVYYFTLEASLFEKFLLEFVQNNSKWMFTLKYLKNSEQSSFEVDYDNCKNSWY